MKPYRLTATTTLSFLLFVTFIFPATFAVAQSISFTKPLFVGSKGEDVRELQKFLNRSGFKVSPAGLDSTGSPRAGSPGNETAYFGSLTATALQAFQCVNGIVCDGTPETTGFGFFGPKTRALISKLWQEVKGAFSGSKSSQLAQVGSGTTYYVSITGNDVNSGTSASPFRTIQRCANAALAGDTCLVSAGTYNETVSTVRSGAQGAWITIRG